MKRERRVLKNGEWKLKHMRRKKQKRRKVNLGMTQRSRTRNREREDIKKYREERR
jgi:hypothetical protein